MTDVEPDPKVDGPVWARADAFPPAPDGWGWLDPKGKSHPCETPEKLALAIREDLNGEVTLAWTPEYPRMVLPEEVPGAGDAVRTARERWTRADLDDAVRTLRWFGLLLAGFGAFAFYRGLVHPTPLISGVMDRLQFAAGTMFRSTTVGIALLMFVIFGFIPWYQARKRRRQLSSWTEAGIAAAVPAIRFETWLEMQKAPVTRFFLGLMALVALAQISSGPNGFIGNLFAALVSGWNGTAAAGLAKNAYLGGEGWRLLTAPFLHGNVVHFLMNMAALAYLGKRLEVFARWPHLALVFLFAGCLGGEASARILGKESVGASGGLMGWLGFLLVFETLHSVLVPRRARRRLAAGVFLTALIGVIGFRFIDNAAHAGGLLAGMLYAAIVFPKSSSPARPRTTITDRVAGGLAFGVLVFSALLAVWKIAGA